MASVYSLAELKSKSSEWLLAARGRGPEHNLDTHAAIESEMLSRGLIVPPIPKHPVRRVVKNTWKHRILISIATVLFVLIAVIVPKFGVMASILLILVVGVVAFVWGQINGKTLPSPLSNEERAALDKGMKDGVTELMISAASGNVERTVELINYGAHVNDVTKNGLTPLMYAAGSGQAPTYLALLNHGAIAETRSKRGLSALEIAEEKGFSSFRAEVDGYPKST